MTKDYYKADDVSMMLLKLAELQRQRRQLKRRLLLHDFRSLSGQEHCHHGLLRRIEIVSRNVENVFNLLPPDMEGRPSNEGTIDATTNLHSFYINLSGACDNLAWLLVFEKGIKDEAGDDIPRTHVGIRRKNKSVRYSLSQELVSKFEQLEDWFEHVENFRHSLAHRIPLYIPPYIVRPKDAEEHQRLDNEAWRALRDHDLDESKRLWVERDKLTFFRPWYTHSHSEGSPSMAIHPQLISDLGAILELSEAVVEEIV